MADIQARRNELILISDAWTLESGLTRTAWLFCIQRDRILLAEKYERCKIALAPGPIRRLPTEILSEIFRYCLPPLRRPDPSTAPLLLCRISSLWQNVAHATSDLWNRLDFTRQIIPDIEPFLRSLPVPPLHQWISHTRITRLDLSFDRLNPEIIPHLVANVLLPNITDILRLEIRLPMGVLHGPFQQFAILPSHTLRSLKFLILPRGVGNAQATVFQSPPHLTHLLLDNLSPAVNPYESGDIPRLHPAFPWPQLTHLVVTHCVEPETLLSVLSLCQSLEEASFYIDLRDSSDASSDSEDENGGHICSGCEIPRLNQPVVLPYLRELDMIVGCGLSFPLADFRFPALKALRVHRGHIHHALLSQTPTNQQRLAAHRPDYFCWKNSVSFLSEMKSLHILSLVGRVGSVKEIMTLLHHVPTVDFLDLNLYMDHRALFRALTVDPQADPTSIPLPRLNCLRLLLEIHDMPSFSEATLREMALSRLQATPGSFTRSRLENLIIGSGIFPREHFRNIRKMVEIASSYIEAMFEVESPSRAIPWIRHVDQGLWRTC